MEEEKVVKCSYCGSKFIYIRIKNNECVCRKCGKVKKLINDLGEIKKEEIKEEN
jgi:uncharacterized Zn-finger protein